MPDCPHCSQAHNDDVLFCPATGKAISVSLLEEGAVIEGKYRVVRRLASGGMGAIYEVEHVGFGKHFAMKLLLPELAQNMEVTQRFEREAKAASAIGHPNIIEITDVGATDNGLRFIVMELLSGGDLGDVLKAEKQLDLPRVKALISQTLLALEAAHSAGIVHRDLKPENVFVHRPPTGGETVKLLDFGISKIAGSDEAKLKLTSTGLILGTPYYMSPEQAKGSREVDHRADLYSVGVILYEAITGRRPYQADNLNSLIYQIIGGSFPAPSTLVADLPEEVENVVLKALAADPADRFQDAASFRAALTGEVAVERPAGLAPAATGPVGRVSADSLMPTIPQSLTPVSVSAQITESQTVSRSRRSFTVVGVVLAVVVAAGLGWFLLSGRGQERASERSSTPQAAQDPAPATSMRPAVDPREVSPRRDPPRRAAPVKITVRATPAEARLELDGAPVAANPFHLPRDGAEHALRVTAPGHSPRLLRFVANESQQLVVELTPEARAAPHRRAHHRYRPRARPHARPRARPAPRRRAPGVMRRRIETTTDI